MSITHEEFQARLGAILERSKRPLTPEELENVRKRSEESDSIWAQQKAQARESELRGRGVPEEFWANVKAPEEREVLAEVRGFMQSGGPKSQLLVLGGEGDAGKSFAGAWAVDAYGGRFVPAVELGRAGSFAPIWEEIERPRLLVIDDLGLEGQDVGGWLAGSMVGLFKARTALKTIVTCNLDGEAFKARYMGGHFARLTRIWTDYGSFAPFDAKGRRIRKASAAARTPGED